MKEKYDTHLTEIVVCPYCGYEDDEIYFYGDYNLEFEGEVICCNSCGKDMLVSRQVTFYYTTEKMQ